jgi:hypothetical protein
MPIWCSRDDDVFDKCYRLVGDFVTENRRYPGSWIPFGSSACLTPREWGIVGPT